MRYFAKLEESQIATNSVQVPAIMKFNGIVKDVTYDGSMCAINLKSECDPDLVAESIADAMEEQMNNDMYSCSYAISTTTKSATTECKKLKEGNDSVTTRARRSPMR